MSQRHIRIFPASKNRHAQKFLDLRNQYPDIHFTARWPIIAGLGSEANRPVYQWMGEAEFEISNSDAMLVYAEPGEVLKTALVYVGMAFSRRIPIWVVGEHESYAEWQFFEGLIHRAPAIKAAMNGIKIHFRGAQKGMIGREVLESTRKTEQ